MNECNNPLATDPSKPLTTVSVIPASDRIAINNHSHAKDIISVSNVHCFHIQVQYTQSFKVVIINVSPYRSSAQTDFTSSPGQAGSTTPSTFAHPL